MHELAITQSMLDLALEQAKKNNAIRIQKVSVIIGEMSGVVDECVRFYFEILSEGTIAEGAKIAIRNIPATARCRQCETRFEVHGMDWICPMCGKAQIEIVGGKELYLESIEVEDED
ncbi:hydrogenase maturation nickel metallochaperone HypA [Candidatus Bipolaricaulota bacterium]|nr:hydrogenase maturation nickel metallochaperone HypA [Candidatus Bipolaricaulota bacterium]MCK4682578.1 hydrogenase maturation nickel metallochaperone HypA [Candidatus Bipolaricaulota bacterium]